MENLTLAEQFTLWCHVMRLSCEGIHYLSQTDLFDFPTGAARLLRRYDHPTNEMPQQYFVEIRNDEGVVQYPLGLTFRSRAEMTLALYRDTRKQKENKL